MREERRNISGRQCRILERRVVVELRRSSEDNRYLFGIAAGVAGVGLSVGLASDLPTWFGVMLHPSNWSAPILGLSLAIVCYFLLKYRRYYERRKRTSYIAVGIVMVASIGIMVSHWFPNFPSIYWIMRGLAVLFYVGVIIGIVLCQSPIRTKCQRWVVNDEGSRISKS